MVMNKKPFEGIPQKITLSAQFKNLEELRNFVGRHAIAFKLNEKQVYQVQLAVDEAFTNIVEHAYGGECQEMIECTCRITDQGLEITMQDCGNNFEPAKIPDPDLHAALEEREVGGLGLFFIRQLMDEVEFKFITETEPARKCNLLRMVKRKRE